MKFKIYKITEIETQRSYVGRTKQKIHLYWGSGKLIQLAISKHGVDKFEKSILEECDELEESKLLEKKWIRELDTKYPNGYNLTSGGEDGDWWEKYEDKEGHSKRSSEQNRKSWERDHERREKVIKDVLNGPNKEEIKQRKLENHKKVTDTIEYRENKSKIGKKIWESKTEEERRLHGEKVKASITPESKERKREKSKKYWTDERKEERSKKTKGIKTSPEDSGRKMNEIRWSKPEEHEKAVQKNYERWQQEGYREMIALKIKKTVEKKMLTKEGEKIRQRVSQQIKDRPRSICSFCNIEIMTCRLDGHIKRFHNDLPTD